MAGLLDRKTIVVRERVRVLKAANAYDLLDPATGQPVGFVEEQVSGFWRKLLRFTSWKTRLSFRITFHDLSAGGAVVLTVSRPFTWFRSVVTVSDATGKPVGTFRQKLLAIGPKMWVLGPGGAEIGMLKGNWIGWELDVVDAADRPLAHISKKWAGLGKELFTSADVYVVDLSDEVKDPDMRRLLFAAAITADMVYKEYA